MRAKRCTLLKLYLMGMILELFDMGRVKPSKAEFYVKTLGRDTFPCHVVAEDLEITSLIEK
jgi:hypothetical protein